MASKRARKRRGYSLKGKTPYRYSELYQKWCEATLRGDEREARHWGLLRYERFVLADLLDRGDGVQRRPWPSVRMAA